MRSGKGVGEAFFVDRPSPPLDRPIIVETLNILQPQTFTIRIRDDYHDLDRGSIVAFFFSNGISF